MSPRWSRSPITFRFEWNQKSRDFILFVGGLIGVGYETFAEKVDRPALLAVFGGMMGLPVFLRRDEKENNDHDASDSGKHKANSPKE